MNLLKHHTSQTEHTSDAKALSRFNSSLSHRSWHPNLLTRTLLQQVEITFWYSWNHSARQRNFLFAHFIIIKMKIFFFLIIIVYDLWCLEKALRSLKLYQMHRCYTSNNVDNTTIKITLIMEKNKHNKYMLTQD